MMKGEPLASLTTYVIYVYVRREITLLFRHPNLPIVLA